MVGELKFFKTSIVEILKFSKHLYLENFAFNIYVFSEILDFWNVKLLILSNF